MNSVLEEPTSERKHEKRLDDDIREKLRREMYDMVDLYIDDYNYRIDDEKHQAEISRDRVLRLIIFSILCIAIAGLSTWLIIRILTVAPSWSLESHYIAIGLIVIIFLLLLLLAPIVASPRDSYEKLLESKLVDDKPEIKLINESHIKTLQDLKEIETLRKDTRDVLKKIDVILNNQLN